MFDARNRGKVNSKGKHHIIICDEEGICDGFYYLREQLSGRGSSRYTLIYVVSDRNLHPLFERELYILERRFPVGLIVHIFRTDTAKNCFHQELLEATINSNTLPVMNFSVYGNEGFADHVSVALEFLDVKSTAINVKTK